MVDLKNIKRNGKIISCDYYPEGKNAKGFVSVNVDTKEILELKIAIPYESDRYQTYARHTIRHLLELSKLPEMPSESYTMWY